MPSELCFPDKKCNFCSFDQKFNAAAENDKTAKEFYEEIAKKNRNLFLPKKIELKPQTPKKNVNVPEDAFFALHWRDKPIPFALCNIDECKSLITYKKSGKNGLYTHIEMHANTKPINRKKRKITETPFDQLTFKKKMSLVLALKMIGNNKISAFKTTSDGMIDTYQAILAAAGVELPKEDIAESRRTIMKTVNEFAEKIRETIKQEIKGKFVTIVHDDSRSSTGMGECIRAVTACFVKNGKYQRRFLHLEYNEGKDSQSIADTIKKVAEMYGIENYQIAADGASVNLSAANKLKVIQNICWSHSVHNIVKATFEAMHQYPGFKKFWSIFEKFLEKSSRRHINSVLAGEDNFVKIPTHSKTRWLSRRDCLAAVVKNWEIIQKKKTVLGLKDDEWNIFNDLDLFKDLLSLVETSTQCLLKFEKQQVTSSQTVLPTLTKWLFKMELFRMDAQKTNFGRLLAEEIIKKIDLYTFGQAGSKIKPRLTATHVIQAAMYPDNFFLAKLKSKMTSKVEAIGGDSQIDSANEAIEQRYNRIYDRLWPDLKSAYDRISNRLDLENSDESSDSELDWSNMGTLSQEQKNLISKQFKKKNDDKMYFQLKAEFKKFKSFIKEYRNWDDNLTGEGNFTSLIRSFKAFKIGNEDHHMLFWSMNEIKLAFPLLHEIVHETIHVPASNAAVESLYSHVTEIKNFKRSKLSSKNLDDILALFYSDLYMENPLTNFFKSHVNK